LKATDEHFDKNQIYAMVLETNGQKEHVAEQEIEPLSLGAQKNGKTF
jgi:hypothetical protein